MTASRVIIDETGRHLTAQEALQAIVGVPRHAIEAQREKWRESKQRQAAIKRLRLALSQPVEADAEADDEPDEPEEVYSDRMPSPDEIRRQCIELQKDWSPRERLKRAGIFGRVSHWMPPTVSAPDDFDDRLTGVGTFFNDRAG